LALQLLEYLIMADRLSWLALLAALTFSMAIVMLGSGGRAAERGVGDPAPACCALPH